MNRTLHWSFVACCAGLVALYARPAWEILSTSAPRADVLVTAATREDPLPGSGSVSVGIAHDARPVAEPGEDVVIAGSL